MRALEPWVFLPKPIAPVVPFAGRPGVSLATAVLLASEVIRKKDHILDVGCGTGTEPLLLAGWGYKRIDAIDVDSEAVRIARGRATKQGLARRVAFHHLDAANLPKAFGPETFDIVLHTLVANNLTKNEVEPHFRGIRDVMKPDGILLVLERVHVKHENDKPGRLPPLRGLKRHFSVSGGISTQLPEGGPGRGGQAFARVVLWLGRPK